MSETPLSDSLNTFLYDTFNGTDPCEGPRYVHTVRLKDCRAIELRLNECVEALRRLTEPYYSQTPAIDNERFAEKALANARRPLNNEVSDGGPLTRDSKQARTRPSLH